MEIHWKKYSICLSCERRGLHKKQNGRFFHPLNYVCIHAFVCAFVCHSPINHGVKEASKTNTINKAEFSLSFANRFVHAPMVSLPFLTGSQSNIQTCTTPRTLSS